MVKRMDDSTARKIEDNDILACVDALSQQLETEENKHVLNVRETENSVILEMAKDRSRQRKQAITRMRKMKRIKKIVSLFR